MQERFVHDNVCQYIKLTYPKVLFRTDLAGIRMTFGQARQAKKVQHGNGWPDLFIAEPRAQYHGLFVELKADGKSVWLKNGTLSVDKHIQEQYGVIKALEANGYMAQFAVGYEEAKKVIDYYLSL